ILELTLLIADYMNALGRALPPGTPQPPGSLTRHGSRRSTRGHVTSTQPPPPDLLKMTLSCSPPSSPAPPLATYQRTSLSHHYHHPSHFTTIASRSSSLSLHSAHAVKNVFPSSTQQSSHSHASVLYCQTKALSVQSSLGVPRVSACGSLSPRAAGLMHQSSAPTPRVNSGSDFFSDAATSSKDSALRQLSAASTVAGRLLEQLPKFQTEEEQQLLLHQRKQPPLAPFLQYQLQTPLTPPLCHKPPLPQKLPLTPPLTQKSLSHRAMGPQQLLQQQQTIRTLQRSYTTRASAVRFLVGPTSTL
ncbi:hypothetical protein FHG87_020069, partial [Trinorchestia longiramus]